MNAWQTAVMIVVAVLAGALLPVLVQLALTLRTSRTVLEDTSVKLGRALDAVTATAERLDRITAGLERTVAQVHESVRIASAVGAAVAPSVGAAVKAWRAGEAVVPPAPAMAPVDGTPSRGADGKEELR